MKLPFIRINFVAIWQFIRNYLLTKRKKVMCFRKLFPNWFKPDPPPVVIPYKRKALLFAINNYPGTANDLNGCLNDQSDVEKKLFELFPDFTIKKFKDSEVTKDRFITELRQALNSLKSGEVLLVHYSGHGTQVFDTHGDEKDGYDEAIYLYNGYVVDEDIGVELRTIPDGAYVVLLFDSCFSESITRAILPQGSENKFVQMPGLPLSKHRKKIVNFKAEFNYIVMSGCQENQTSADAFINGRFNGAFTYYALKALTSKDLTYSAWFKEMLAEFDRSQYDQVPTLEGREDLLNRRLFT